MLDYVPPFFRHLYEADFRSADEAIRAGRVAAATKKREKCFDDSQIYVRPLQLELEPDLSNASHAFAQRALSADTTSGAISAVGTTIALARGTNPTKLEGTDKFAPRIGQMLDGWRKTDKPTEKKLPVEVDVPNHVATLGGAADATPLAQAVGDLVLVAFYFLLRVGEYTCRGNGAAKDADKQTEQFKVSDVRFFAKNRTTGALQQLPPWARPVELLAATHATLRLGNQKNGWKNVCVHQEANGHEHLCTVKALARRIIHIMSHVTDRDCLLSAYWEGGERMDVAGDDISKAVKKAAEELCYPEDRNIEVDQVDTHSLRMGGANALSLAGYSDRQITKMGRWKSATFLEHIREELGISSAGMSRKMAQTFKCVNLTGDKWSNVTDAVVVSDYESGEE